YLQRSLRSLAKGKIKTVVQRRIGLGLERHIRLSKTFLVVLGNLVHQASFRRSGQALTTQKQILDSNTN
ncbi:hypothetical protein AACB39_00030, partial [Enterococcus faecalis]